MDAASPVLSSIPRRPRRMKPASERRPHNISFAATNADRASFLAAARRDGLSLSAWIRRILLRHVGALPGAEG